MAKWMQSLHLKKGALTAQASRAGKSISEFCASKKHGTTARRCALAKTFKRASKGRKSGR